MKRLTSFVIAQLFILSSISPTFAISDTSQSHLRAGATRASDGGAQFLVRELREGAPHTEAEALAKELGNELDLSRRISRLIPFLQKMESPSQEWLPNLTYALAPQGKKAPLYTTVEKNQEEIFEQCQSCGVRLFHSALISPLSNPSPDLDRLGALATAIDAVTHEGLITTHPKTHEVMHSAYALSQLMDGTVGQFSARPKFSDLENLRTLLSGGTFLMAHAKEIDLVGDHFVQVKAISDQDVTLIDRGEEKTVSRQEFLKQWTGVVISPDRDKMVHVGPKLLKDSEAQKIFGCCGIVGYTRLDAATKIPLNTKPITPLVTRAASGVAQRAGRHGQGVTAWSFDDQGNIFSETRKVTEGAEALTEDLEIRPLAEKAFTFLFHGRWPTQGKNTVSNAHPHRVGLIELAENGDATNNGELLAFLRGEKSVKGEIVGEVTLTEPFLGLLSSRPSLTVFVAQQLGMAVGKYVSDVDKPKKEEIETLQQQVLAELKRLGNRLDLRVEKPAHITTDAWTLAALVNYYFILELLEGRDSKMAMLHAMRRARRLIQGYFSIWVIDRDEPWRIYGLGIEDQPMVIGVGGKEAGKEVGNFLTSDPIAFLDYTDQAVFLQNNDYVIVTHDNYEIYRLPTAQEFSEDFPFVLEEKAPTAEEAEFTAVSKEERPSHRLNQLEFKVTKEHRGEPYSYYTEKEIYQQPDTIRATMQEDNRIGILRQLALGEEVEMPGIHLSKKEIRRLKRVRFVASGTSEHASLMAQSKFFKAARMDVDVIDGQELVESIQDYVVEYLYALAKKRGLPITKMEISRRLPVSEPGTIAHVIKKYGIKIPGVGGPEEVVIAVSQSGNTKDTLGALRLLKALGTKMIAVVNKPGLPPIAQAAVEVKTTKRGTQRVVRLFRTKAGLEKGVASTKATTSQVVAAQLIGLYFGLIRGTYEPELALEYLDGLEEIPDMAGKMLKNQEMHDTLQRVAKRLITKQSTPTMGRGGKSRGLGWAKETSLKAEELGYQTFKPLHLSGMKHGPIAVFPDDFDVRVREYVIASLLDMGTHNESIVNLNEIIARQGIPILFVYEGESVTDLKELVKKAGSDLELITIPKMDDPDLAVILSIIPAQLLAFYTAREIHKVSLQVQDFARKIYWAMTEWERVGGDAERDRLKEAIRQADGRFNDLWKSGELGVILDPVKWDINRGFKVLKKDLRRIPPGKTVSQRATTKVRQFLRELKDDHLSTILFFEELYAVRRSWFPSQDPRSKITGQEWDEIEATYRKATESEYGEKQFEQLVKQWRTFLAEKKIEEGFGEDGLIDLYQRYHVTRGLAQKLERHIDLPRGLAKEVTVNDGGRRASTFFAESEGFEPALDGRPILAHLAPRGDVAMAKDGASHLGPVLEAASQIGTLLEQSPTQEEMADRVAEIMRKEILGNKKAFAQEIGLPQLIAEAKARTTAEDFHYTRKVLYHDPVFGYDLVAIIYVRDNSYTKGEHTPIHNHGGNVCVFCVLEGKAIEYRFEVTTRDVGEAEIVLKEKRALQEGDVEKITETHNATHVMGNFGLSDATVEIAFYQKSLGETGIDIYDPHEGSFVDLLAQGLTPERPFPVPASVRRYYPPARDGGDRNTLLEVLQSVDELRMIDEKPVLSDFDLKRILLTAAKADEPGGDPDHKWRGALIRYFKHRSPHTLLRIFGMAETMDPEYSRVMESYFGEKEEAFARRRQVWHIEEATHDPVWIRPGEKEAVEGPTLFDFREMAHLNRSLGLKPTPLVASQKLSDRYDRHIYWKLEPANPTGSQKDRLRGYIYNEITRRLRDREFVKKLLSGEEVLYLITASTGNEAIAVAKAGNEIRKMFPELLKNMQIIVYVSKDIVPEKAEYLKKLGATLIDKDELHRGDEGFASYEAARLHGTFIASQDKANRVFVPHGTEVLSSFGTMTLEIVEQLKEMGLDSAKEKIAVIVPMGSGGMALGLERAFSALGVDAMMVGVQVPGANSMVQSLFREEHVNLGTGPIPTLADGIGTSTPEVDVNLVRKRFDIAAVLGEGKGLRAAYEMHREAETYGDPVVREGLKGEVAAALPAAFLSKYNYLIPPDIHHVVLIATGKAKGERIKSWLEKVDRIVQNGLSPAEEDEQIQRLAETLLEESAKDGGHRDVIRDMASSYLRRFPDQEVLKRLQKGDESVDDRKLAGEVMYHLRDTFLSTEPHRPEMNELYQLQVRFGEVEGEILYRTLRDATLLHSLKLEDPKQFKKGKEYAGRVLGDLEQWASDGESLRAPWHAPKDASGEVIVDTKYEAYWDAVRDEASWNNEAIWQFVEALEAEGLGKTLQRFAKSGEPFVVVEVGTGNGPLIQALLKLFEKYRVTSFKIRATDVNPLWLASGYKYHAGNGNVEFHLARSEDEKGKPFSDFEALAATVGGQKAHLVVGSHVPHLIQDFGKFVKGVQATLHPGGIAAFQSLNVDYERRRLEGGPFLIDNTASAAHDLAVQIIRSDPGLESYRSLVMEDAVAKAVPIRQKTFLPVRGQEYYLEAFRANGFEILIPSSLPIYPAEFVHVSYEDWGKFLNLELLRGGILPELKEHPEVQAKVVATAVERLFEEMRRENEEKGNLFTSENSFIAASTVIIGRLPDAAEKPPVAPEQFAKDGAYRNLRVGELTLKTGILPDLLEMQVEKYGDRTFLVAPTAEGYKEISFNQFNVNVERMKKALYDEGVRPKDKIAFLSPNRPEFMETVFGAWGLGAAVVSMSFRAPPVVLEHMISNSDATYLIVSAGPLLQAARALKAKNLNLKKIFVLDPLPKAALQEGEISLATWKEGETETVLPAVDIKPEDVALILYTSGTTKLPKGVPLTHQNLLYNREASRLAWEGDLTDEDITLGWLPFFHVMGLPYEFLGNLYVGAKYAFPRLRPGPPTPDQLLASLSESGANVFYSVPWMLEGLMAMAKKDPTVLDKLRKLKFIMSGGVVLSEEVGEYFQRNGVNVIQGEGMTDVGGAIFLGDPKKRDWRTLRVIPGMNADFVPIEGLAGKELVLDNSPTVFSAYLKNPEATADVYKEPGRFHTGDLFAEVEGGYVYVGRLDEAGKYLTGEWFNPLQMEMDLEKSPFVKRVAKIGINRPHAIAIVQPDYEALRGKQWAEIEEILWEAFDRVNQDYPDYDRVRRENILIMAPGEEPLPLSPKGSLIRSQVEKRFADRIEALYTKKERVKEAQRRRNEMFEKTRRRTSGLQDIVKRATQKELTLALVEERRRTDKVVVTGRDLNIARVTAVARGNVPVALTRSPKVRAKVDRSVAWLAHALENGADVYGVTAGFGGSADVRTNHTRRLQAELIRFQNAGFGETLPDEDVRGSMLIRANSNVKGYSGLRWLILENLTILLNKEITPVVPERGSITASGDLTPLAHIVGVLLGKEDSKAHYQGKTISAKEALHIAGLEPIVLGPKEGLALINGTSVSNALAATVLYDANILALLAQATTALSVESLLGTNQSYDPLVQAVKGHPGQVEAGANLLHLLKGSQLARDELKGDEKIEAGRMRQDRYAIRTAPQWFSSQLEVLLDATERVTTEMNAVTDNPLIDVEGDRALHTGNFQGTPIAVSMENVRLSLQAIGKLVYAQYEELINKAFNNSLPANLAGSADLGLDFGFKGAEIGMASYMSELAFLANPVTTHVQSAELHNQDVNSLGLISARVTRDAVTLLQMMLASHLYANTQAVDLRNIEQAYGKVTEEVVAKTLEETLPKVVKNWEEVLPLAKAYLLREVRRHPPYEYAFSSHDKYRPLFYHLAAKIDDILRGDPIAVGDQKVILLEKVETSEQTVEAFSTYYIDFENLLTNRLDTLFPKAKEAALQQGASHLLGNTRPLYEFIRRDLGIRFVQADKPPGPQIEVIFKAIQDGRIVEPLLESFLPTPTVEEWWASRSREQSASSDGGQRTTPEQFARDGGARELLEREMVTLQYEIIGATHPMTGELVGREGLKDIMDVMRDEIVSVEELLERMDQEAARRLRPELSPIAKILLREFLVLEGVKITQEFGQLPSLITADYTQKDLAEARRIVKEVLVGL